jgi:hypothetical protein
MTAAILIQNVEANGGQMRVEDGWLVIAPEEAATPYLQELRKHKAEIIGLLLPQSLLHDENTNERRPEPLSTLWPQDRPAADPTEWLQPFIWWLDADCTLQRRGFGGVDVLHRAFCRWEIGRDGVPCDRQTFIRILEELEFLVAEVEGTMLVSGILLRSDWEASGLDPMHGHRR